MECCIQLGAGSDDVFVFCDSAPDVHGVGLVPYDPLRLMDGKADLAKSACYRTLCADGSISESVGLAGCANARPVADDEVEDWIPSYPSRRRTRKALMVRSGDACRRGQ